MKRICLSILFVAAAVMIACEKQSESVIETPVNENETYVFSLKATSPDIVTNGTKTEYSASGAFSWSAGDQISVIFNNGTENKYFTLTTSDSGPTADFSGSIDAGYTIGELSSGTKIALYPASDHKYVAADSKPIKFNMPAVIDFTTSHYSANMPLYAEGDADNNFAFQNLACGFKFKFTEVSASKAKLVVQSQNTYQLSGDIPIHPEGPYLYNDYASIGSQNGSLTLIANVENETVTFFVPFRYYSPFFPIITLYDAETDEVLYTNTAKKAGQINSLGHVKPFTISVTGFVYSFPSKYGIDWNSEPISGEGDSGSSNSGIKVIKAKADASYLYFYFVVDKNKLTTDDANEYANQAVFYLGDESDANCTNTSWIWGNDTYTADATGGWLTYYGKPAFYSWETLVGPDTGNKAGSATAYGDDFYYEIRIRRNNTKAPMTSTSESIAHVGMIIYHQKIHGVSGGSSVYLIAPKTASHGGAMLRVPLPAYVAPTE